MFVRAGMAELADAHGSGPCGSNTMRVQVSFPALDRKVENPSKLEVVVFRGGFALIYRLEGRL